MEKAILVAVLLVISGGAASAEDRSTLSLEGGNLFGSQFSNPTEPSAGARTFDGQRLEVSPKGDPVIGGRSEPASNSSITYGSKVEIEVGR